MSQPRNEVASQLEILVNSLRGRDIPTLKSYEPDEMVKIQDALALWLHVAWDVSCSTFEVGDVRSIIQRWLNCVTSHPFETTLQACKTLAASLVERQFTSYDDFKRHHRSGIPWVGELCSPICRCVFSGMGASNTLSFCRIRTFLLFLTRLNLRHVTLKNEAQERFVKSLDRQTCRISGLEPIIRKWFANADCKLDEWCHHGPGRVAELPKRKCTVVSKYGHFKTDELLEYCSVPFSFEKKGLKRVSKLICVAKSFDKYRTICAEPSILQWCQQGVAHYLCEAISHSPLRKHVDLKRQDTNRELARLGSIDGSFATIDLSNASDSVMWTLVRESFKHTVFLRYFYACRSRQVKVGREVFSLPMFATMGSALTFPVECIIFSAIVELAFTEENVPETKRHYRVYGDDIICPSWLAPRVMTLLEEFGFAVNHDKSFFDPSTFFRESCGGEFVQGEDVTPIRISRRFEGLSNLRFNGKRYECALDLANRFYYLYPETRCFLISQMRKQGLVPRFTSQPEGSGSALYSEHATNWLAERRWHFSNDLRKSSYQRFEIRVHIPALAKIARDENFGDDLRLFEWLRSSQCVPDRPYWDRLEHVYDGAAEQVSNLELRWVLDENQEG